ncbi:MAG TPA: DedA family protein [Thermoanaerobaculaceae bacterium]|nr:DedA family protein [Thermoanaerobaculaceae bacterium]
METFTYWLSRYGYFGLFSLLMLGIVGVPIPEETLLTFSGVLVYRGHLELLPTLLAAFLGSCCGITVSYGLGRFFGLMLTTRFGRMLHVNPEKVEQVHLWFERVGHWGLLWGYFLPGIRHLTAILAGATRLRYADFALFAYAGALVWSFTFVSLGALAGRQWARVSAEVHHNLLIASGVVAALLLCALVVRQVLARRQTGRS